MTPGTPPHSSFPVPASLLLPPLPFYDAGWHLYNREGGPHDRGRPTSGAIRRVQAFNVGVYEKCFDGGTLASTFVLSEPRAPMSARESERPELHTSRRSRPTPTSFPPPPRRHPRRFTTPFARSCPLCSARAQAMAAPSRRGPDFGAFDGRPAQALDERAKRRRGCTSTAQFSSRGAPGMTTAALMRRLCANLGALCGAKQ